MIEQLWPYLKYFFGFIGVVAAVEIYLSSTWWPGYFMNGIPIYRRRLMVAPEVVEIPTSGEIEAALPDSGWSTPMHVRLIGDNRFAFRETMCHFDLSYPPVMHGSFSYDRRTGEIKVRGFANSYAALFTCFFILAPLALPLEPVDYIFPLFVLGLFIWIYRVQVKRYRQVESAVQQVWPRG